jgi:hypothetical protein
MAGKQWRELRNIEVDKCKQFTNGVYSIQRHTCNVNMYNYIEPPPHSSLSNKVLQLGCSKSGNSDVEHVQSEKVYR